jgi:tRNA A37 threonylcarbamoyladenosine modification protein TsaB
MKLYISTASHTHIILELRSGKTIIASKEIEAAHRQAEKLLPELETMLKKLKKPLKDIKGIIVENKGVGFTDLRIGVSTANALAYALGISLETPEEGKVRIARPLYFREPSITKKKL